jgi:YHS domain-containing protein
MVKDPVCGMDVDENKAAGTAEYNGKKYYFCSPACKTKFEKTPDQYAKA